MSVLRDAYHRVIENAESAGRKYVSLYVRAEYYGGPEEGGWWGHDSILESYVEVSNMDMAERIYNDVYAEVERMNAERKADHNAALSRQCDEAWNRGEDLDDVGYAGPDEYFVVIESVPGECASVGERCYS